MLITVNDSLPLPEDVPMSFRILPEYIIEDIVDYLAYAVRFVAYMQPTIPLICSINTTLPDTHRTSSSFRERTRF